MRNKLKIILIEIISFLLIFLFVYAAVSKLLDFQRFQIQLSQSPILAAFSRTIAVLVPALEIIISIMLILSKFRIFGLYASFSLMVMFITYIITIKSTIGQIPCSCGGVLQNMSWNQHLIFNVWFVLLVLAAIILYPNHHVLRLAYQKANGEHYLGKRFLNKIVATITSFCRRA